MLDNPVWHALRGPQAHLGEVSRNGRAARFAPDVAIFAAVEDLEEGAWAGLFELVGPGGLAIVFRPDLPSAPAGAVEAFRVPCQQMIAGATPDPDGLEPMRLGADDVPEMKALVELTDPGPFAARTIDMGEFFGVRQRGKLVAMAGQRMRLPGYQEVTAVCTHPDARGRGLAARLTSWVVMRTRAVGNEAILHVKVDNHPAIRLYESLGFRTRSRSDVIGLRRAGA